ncbi:MULTISPECIES: 2-dehydropantoate 2-reductase [Bacillus]|uniref:2-dehydropantoate 2-reductase n=1 Tax=Bacillus TaxID=1386 RepID=UPI000C79430C|nr:MULTISPECIES: 2-dehydropantoate 2-reductase [Bacillus]PLR80982.1 2-dehydropantoate 2-reductase [Bacillus sp. V33-4]RSK53195.1 2-dehydropantoate 2-reductase [Bacillus canaveralius]
MKIGIIGAGSIGLLFGYYLQSYHHVTIYTNSVEQAEAIRAAKLSCVKNGQPDSVPIEALPFSSWNGEDELTVIAVKAYQLPAVLEQIKLKSSNSGSFLFLQNGMGHLRWLDELSAENIYAGSVEHGAYRTGQASVNHTGTGVTKVAVFKGSDFLLRKMIAPLSGEFPFVLEDNVEKMLISKLIVNAVINPLTAVLNVRNGQLIENPYYYRLLQKMFSEIKAILDLHDADSHYQNVLRICNKTASNYSSMLTDIKNGRMTEIDSILGYIVAEAERKKIEAPLVDAFFQCIKGKEYGGEEI